MSSWVRISANVAGHFKNIVTDHNGGYEGG